MEPGEQAAEANGSPDQPTSSSPEPTGVPTEPTGVPEEPGHDAVELGGAEEAGRWGRWIELAFVAAIVVNLVAFGLVNRAQHQGDSLASATVVLAKKEGINRVLWPAELRGSVPLLIQGGLVPVLTDQVPIPAQQAAVNLTPLVVTRDGSGLDEVTTAVERSGDHELRTIDVEAAEQTPIDAGQRLSREYARPYVFAPLRTSLRVTNKEPLELDFTLLPGSYRFSIDIMDNNVSSTLDLTVSGATLVEAPPKEFRNIVMAPTIAGIEVEGDGASPVQITVAFELKKPKGKAKPKTPDIRVHRWSLERVAG